MWPMYIRYMGSELNDQKRITRAATAKAIRAGLIQRLPCEVCGTKIDIECHHRDYSNPFDIQWPCYVHHLEAHGKKIGLIRQVRVTLSDEQTARIRKVANSKGMSITKFAQKMITDLINNRISEESKGIDHEQKTSTPSRPRTGAGR